MLGSVQDAEDALLAAWQGLPGFEGRASVRTWLYRVVTTRVFQVLTTAAEFGGWWAPASGSAAEGGELRRHLALTW